MSFLTGSGEMGERIRTYNWAETSLGPIETWPQSLRTSLSLILTSYYPLFFWWGEDHIQFYNDAYTPILGAKHPKSLGQKGKECWPEAWHLVEPMIKAVKGGESTFNKNTLLPLQRNGYTEECYFDFAYSPIRNESGEVAGIFAAVSETTEQVINERRLGLLTELGMHILEAKSVKEACQIPLQVLSKSPIDIPYALIYLKEGDSYKLVESYGLDAHAMARPATITPQTISSAWRLNDATATEQPYLQESLTAIFGELPGTPWPAPSHAAVLTPLQLPAQEEPVGVFVAGISPGKAFNDAYSKFLRLVSGHIENAISNGKTYEEERMRMQKLVELDQAKTNFFNNISHEFRTPLTLMLGPLKDVISGAGKALPEADKKQLSVVYQNSQRLLKLVNTLLDFSRIEAKRAQASYEPTELGSLTSDLASAFEPTMERAGLNYQVVCPPLSEAVYVDQEMWEKIVLNLISNAFKFTFEGQISIKLRETATHAELTVQDTGVGIPQEELPNLFKRFHRVQNSRSRSHEGTGIGLALVKELVELHSGTVEVKSSPGKGTTFTVSIPKGTAHLNETRIGAGSHYSDSTAIRAESYVNEAVLWGKHDAEAEMLQEEKPAVTEGYIEPDKSTRILLVDDNADLLSYLKRILSAYWHVEAVRDGAEALAAAKRITPDLILSDVMMPNMNGFELLAAIRKDISLSHIPVILLSARAGEEATIEGLEQGANDYLAKPFSTLELLARVKTQLEILRTRKDNHLLKQTEEELKKFKTISDYAFDAFILMREDGTFAYLNDLALRRWDYTREEAQHIRVPDVDPIYQEEKFNEIFARAQRQYIPPFETLHRRKDGSVYPVEVSMGGLTLEGKPHMFAIARDITERKLAEETLKARNEELLKTNNDLDNFIYTASHDLKAPITNIEGLVNTLVDDLPVEVLADPEIDNIITMMRGSIGRFKNTVNELTDLTKLHRHTEDDISEINLTELFEDVCLDLEKPIRETGALIEMDFDEYPSIGFSKKNLRSIIYNLMSNAIKYHSPERTPFIRATSGVEQGMCVLTVEDNGLGIDLAQEKKIFSMFKRLHDHVEGSGIGLYIVRRIVENTGGRIQVESEVGKGSTFKVYLNCKKVKVKAEKAQDKDLVN